jgi:hypothetical protein
MMQSKFACLASPVAFSVIIAVTLVKLSSATVGTVSKADLSGNGQVTLYGQGGCGVGTSLVTFNLNGSGVGTATNKSHTVGCGDTTTTGNTLLP